MGELGRKVGAGCGVVGLALALACPRLSVSLVELGGRLAVLARRNVAGNALSDMVAVYEADLRRLQGSLPEGGLALAGWLLHDPAVRGARLGASRRVDPGFSR